MRKVNKLKYECISYKIVCEAEFTHLQSGPSIAHRTALIKLVLDLHAKNCAVLCIETSCTKYKHSCSDDKFSELPAEVLLKPWNCLVHDPPVAVNDMLLEPARVAKKVCNDINIFQTKVRQLVNVAILKFF